MRSLKKLQQLLNKRTTKDFLKGLQSNPFKKSLGLGLNAKRFIAITDKSKPK
jgi:hypothetical protein